MAAITSSNEIDIARLNPLSIKSVRDAEMMSIMLREAIADIDEQIRDGGFAGDDWLARAGDARRNLNRILNALDFRRETLQIEYAQKREADLANNFMRVAKKTLPEDEYNRMVEQARG